MHHEDYNEWEYNQSKMRRDFYKQKQRAEIGKSYMKRQRRESLYHWAASISLCVAVVGFVYLVVLVSR